MALGAEAFRVKGQRVSRKVLIAVVLIDRTRRDQPGVFVQGLRQSASCALFPPGAARSPFPARSAFSSFSSFAAGSPSSADLASAFWASAAFLPLPALPLAVLPAGRAPLLPPSATSRW